MSFVKIIYDNNSYDYNNANSTAMAILGLFLSSDVGCGSRINTWPSFKDWALNDSLGECLSGNITRLEKENGNILLTNSYSEEKTPTELKITQEQFVQILTDWEEKVCKLRPKEVTITYENDQFVIETKN
jgi:hypothetical protein